MIFHDVISSQFGPDPMPYNCSICHTQQVTRVNYKSGALTWFMVYDGIISAGNTHNIIYIYYIFSVCTCILI